MAVAALALVAAIPVGATPTHVKTLIRSLKHSPKVVYDDQMLVFADFKVARRARPGWEWGAVLSVTGKYAQPGYCNPIALSWEDNVGVKFRDRRLAGPQMFSLGSAGHGYLCRGEATIHIVEHKIGTDVTYHLLGPKAEQTFRIISAP